MPLINKTKLAVFMGFRDSDGVKYEAMLTNSLFQNIWSVLNVVCLTYVGLVLPVRLAWESFFGCNRPLMIIDAFIDVFYMADVVVNIFTGYRTTARVETKLAKTVPRYVKGWFVIDAIAAIPGTLILIGIGSGCGGLASILVAFKLLRLIRLVKIVKVVKIFHHLTWIERFRILFSTPNRLVFSLTKLIGIVVFVMHLAACVYWFLKSFDPRLEEWEALYRLQDVGFVDLYVTSLYFVTATIATVGYGDIKAENSLERGYCFILMLIGTGMFATIISTISSLIHSTTAGRKKYEQQMIMLTDFFDFHNIEPNIQDKVAAYFRYHDEVDSFKTNIQSLTSQLPGPLADEMRLHLVKRIVGGTSGPFSCASDSYLLSLFPLLHPLKLSPDERIFAAGDIANMMYFVYHGCVELALGDGSRVTVKEGSFNLVGEEAMLSRFVCKRTFSAKSQTFATVYVVSRKDFLSITDRRSTVMLSLKRYCELHSLHSCLQSDMKGFPQKPMRIDVMGMDIALSKEDAARRLQGWWLASKVQTHDGNSSRRSSGTQSKPLLSPTSAAHNGNRARSPPPLSLMQKVQSVSFGESLLSRLKHLADNSPAAGQGGGGGSRSGSMFTAASGSGAEFARRESGGVESLGLGSVGSGMRRTDENSRSTPRRRRRRHPVVSQLPPLTTSTRGVGIVGGVEILKDASERLTVALGMMRLEELGRGVDSLRGSKDAKMESLAMEVIRTAELIQQVSAQVAAHVNKQQREGNTAFSSPSISPPPGTMARMINSKVGPTIANTSEIIKPLSSSIAGAGVGIPTNSINVPPNTSPTPHRNITSNSNVPPPVPPTKVVPISSSSSNNNNNSNSNSGSTIISSGVGVASGGGAGGGAAAAVTISSTPNPSAAPPFLPQRPGLLSAWRDPSLYTLPPHPNAEFVSSTDVSLSEDLNNVTILGRQQQQVTMLRQEHELQQRLLRRLQQDKGSNYNTDNNSVTGAGNNNNNGNGNVDAGMTTGNEDEFNNNNNNNKQLADEAGEEEEGFTPSALIPLSIPVNGHHSNGLYNRRSTGGDRNGEDSPVTAFSSNAVFPFIPTRSTMDAISHHQQQIQSQNNNNHTYSTSSKSNEERIEEGGGVGLRYYSPMRDGVSPRDVEDSASCSTGGAGVGSGLRNLTSSSAPVRVLKRDESESNVDKRVLWEALV